MTVKQLIEQLSTIENQDAIVMTGGYEGGYDEVNNITNPIDMALNVHTEWYYGAHERAKDADGEYQIVKAIIM